MSINPFSKVIGSVVEMAVTIAFDSAVKLASPSNMKAVSGFVLKGASMLAGAAISGYVSSIVSDKTELIIATLQVSPDEEVNDDVDESPTTSK